MSIVNRFPASCPDQDTFIPQNLEPTFGYELKTTSNVSSPPLATDTENIVSKEGTVLLAQTSAGAWLLPAPVAGLPGVVAGGQDMKKLTILDITGHAHTVTTPASAINGASHILTFGGTKGEKMEITAYNGVWYAYGSSGVTIS
jgi:hypothetical protein